MTCWSFSLFFAISYWHYISIRYTDIFILRYIFAPFYRQSGVVAWRHAKSKYALPYLYARICRQKAVVGVHHKRNPFGIVVKPTAQRGLLLGMCS